MHIVDITNRCLIVNYHDRPYYGLCAIEYCGQALYLYNSPSILHYRLPLNESTPIRKFGVQVLVDRALLINTSASKYRSLSRHIPMGQRDSGKVATKAGTIYDKTLRTC